MHEMGIASALVEQLAALARQHGVARITALHVVCGAMRQVVPEALQWAFAAASAGTVADGATLTVSEQGVTGRCRHCGQQFAAQIDDYRCPQCSVADVEVLTGQDIVLESVMCEMQDETAV